MLTPASFQSLLQSVSQSVIHVPSRLVVVVHSYSLVLTLSHLHLIGENVNDGTWRRHKGQKGKDDKGDAKDQEQSTENDIDDGIGQNETAQKDEEGTSAPVHPKESKVHGNYT